MEQAIKTFLEYGAMGILALAFSVQLILFVRADKRANLYALQLEGAQFDRRILLEALDRNTRGAVSLADKLGEMNRVQDRTAEAIKELNIRLENWQCPFRKNEA